MDGEVVRGCRRPAGVSSAASTSQGGGPWHSVLHPGWETHWVPFPLRLLGLSNVFYRFQPQQGFSLSLKKLKNLSAPTY